MTAIEVGGVLCSLDEALEGVEEVLEVGDEERLSLTALEGLRDVLVEARGALADALETSAYGTLTQDQTAAEQERDQLRSVVDRIRHIFGIPHEIGNKELPEVIGILQATEIVNDEEV